MIDEGVFFHVGTDYVKKKRKMKDDDDEDWTADEGKFKKPKTQKNNKSTKEEKQTVHIYKHIAMKDCAFMHDIQTNKLTSGKFFHRD